MWTIAEDIADAAYRKGLSASILDQTECERTKRALMDKYGRSGRWPLWDGPGDDAFIQSDTAWRLIAEYVGNNPCVILWDPETERKCVRFERGTDLVSALEECHRTEFYVTDPETSFLLCFNHHDYLIGSGGASAWLQNRR